MIDNSSSHVLGMVSTIQDSILIITGLADAFIGEVVTFKIPYSNSLQGFVMNLEHGIVKVVIIRGDQTQISTGDKVFRTKEALKTKSGFGVLDKVVNPFGELTEMETELTSDKSVKQLFRVIVYSLIFHQMN